MKEKIAIVGCGVKVPGADTLDEYWNLLERGENHVTEIPLSRWNHEAYYSKDRQAAGKTHAKRAGLLKDPLAFDNDLFNISDIEADHLDPQQRYVLECVYRAMEDGGFTKEQLKAQGTNVGVYVGAMNNDYRGQFNASQSASLGTTVTGTYNTVIAARVSFVFDFRGPSMTIDTACSSALVAVHLGVQALRTGDCDMAVCGGTNSTLTPDVFIHIGKAGMASTKGQCSTFSDKADGYVRGEGSAIVILKRLSDVTESDKVWAIIDTACNHDGGSVKAIPQPSEKQQYELLQTIYAQADPDTIQYIEAHGTGTSAGDRAEVNALGKFFSAQKSQVRRYIGAVKPNIGHLESAAGTASLIKVLLMMKHSKIVPTLLFGNLNPKIDFEGMKLTVPTAVVEWPNQKKESCLNSFGVGGTNCHAVIHSHNRLMALQNGRTIHSTNSHIVCFSGKSQQSLTGCIKDFLSYPGAQNLDIHDVSYTSTVGREHYKCRQAFVVSSIEELMNCLRGHLSTSSKAPTRLPLRAQQKANIIFVFSGMSSDWVGMGVEMMKGSREFRIAIQDIDQILSEFVDWSLEARLSTETDQKDLNFWPIAIFAVQIGLARLWESLGIVPDSVIGYSMGEVAAAHVAGYLSLKDAVKVIYSRTKVLAELENDGKMIVVKNMPIEVVKDLLKDFTGKAVVSAEISPVCCAISGKADHIAQVQRALLEKVNDENQRIDIISLPVSVAYHSHCVDPCKERLAQMLEDVSPREPKVKMISTVSGQFINSSKDEKLDKTYWVDNMRESIKFLDAVKNSLNSGQDNIYVEIGPKPFMGPHVKDISPDTVLQTIPSMVKKGGLETFLKAVSHVYQNGCIVRWQNVPGFLEGQEITPVPRYCFQPRRYLHCSEGAFVTLHGVDLWKSSHPFVYKMQMCDVYKVMLSEFTFPSVYDHRISSEIVVPGALYAEVGFALAKYIHQTRDPECSLSVTFSKMCHLETEKPLCLDVEVSKGELKHEKTGDFNVVLTKDNITLASIRVHQQSRNDLKRVMSIPEVNDRCCTQLNKSEISQVMKSWGFRYGPNYSLLTQARIGDQECLAEMHFPSYLLPEMLGTTMHPSITDAMLQTGLILLNEHEATSRDVFPTSIGRLTCFKATSNEMFIHTRATRSVGNMSVFDMRLLSKHGETIALIEDMVLTRLTEQDAETFAKSTWVPLVRNYIRKLKVLPTSTECVKYGNNGTSIGDIKAVLNDVANKSSG